MKKKIPKSKSLSLKYIKLPSLDFKTHANLLPNVKQQVRHHSKHNFVSDFTKALKFQPSKLSPTKNPKLCFEHTTCFNLHKFPAIKCFKYITSYLVPISEIKYQKPRNENWIHTKAEIMAHVGRMAKCSHHFCHNQTFEYLEVKAKPLQCKHPTFLVSHIGNCLVAQLAPDDLIHSYVP